MEPQKQQSRNKQDLDLSEVDTGYSSDSEHKPKKVPTKLNDKLNQSTSAVFDTRGKCCCVCFKKEGFFEKFARCPVCSRLVCGDHCKSTVKSKAVCDSCYKRVVVETRRSYRDENTEVLTKLKDELEALVIKRDELMSKKTQLNRKQTERDGVVQQKRKHYTAAEEAARQRMFNEQSRNDSVQSQLKTMMQAYEDAKRSEFETTKRQTDQLVMLDGLKIELSFIEQQKEQLSAQLKDANSKMNRLINPLKFFEYACRPCKTKFVNQFRTELLRDRVDVDNLSFIDANAMQFKSTDRGERDTCRCAVM